ncbi:MAG: hypothetical protein LUQ26_06130 [Methylococcaceae bacterium]|nr:hypothetical protein [Methylococcaceae bacterium]
MHKDNKIHCAITTQIGHLKAKPLDVHNRVENNPDQQDTSVSTKNVVIPAEPAPVRDCRGKPKSRAMDGNLPRSFEA